MRRIAGVLFIFLIFSLAPVAAQYPQYRHGGPPPAPEECPQGQEIRAKKFYPTTMTDCQVLDEDTRIENQKKRQAVPAPAAPKREIVQPSPPSPGLAEYKRTMMPIIRAMNYAVWVGRCRLRSLSYVDTLTTSAQMVAMQESHRLNISSQEMRDADAEFDKVLVLDDATFGAPDLSIICDGIRNSPKLDALDLVYREVTGNYH